MNDPMSRKNIETVHAARRAIKEIALENIKFSEDRGPEYFRRHMTGQTPHITLVTCSDSRVQSKAILPDSINRIFTIRNIGNQIASCEGSVDYGVYHLHTPVLLILGHSDCGAIKAFMGGYREEPSSIKTELDNLRDALSNLIEHSSEDKAVRFEKEEEDKAGWRGHGKDRKSQVNCVPRAVQANVDHQVSVALEKYEYLVREGKLAVVGAFYDFGNDAGKGHGRIVFININGETDEGAIRNSPVLAELGASSKENSTGRL